MFSTSSRPIPTFLKDFDVTAQPCTVKIIYESRLKKLLAKRVPSAVVFEFANRSVMYHCVESSGCIWPSWRDATGEGFYMKSPQKVGKLVVSPRTIYELARNHQLNGTKYYDNCNVAWITMLGSYLNTSMSSSGGASFKKFDFDEGLTDVGLGLTVTKLPAVLGLPGAMPRAKAFHSRPHKKSGN